MKNKIIVHTPQNEISSYYRYYNQFWFKFIDFLKTKFDVIEDTYFIDANKRNYVIDLLETKNVSLLECEMIIENVQTKEFVVLSVSDVITSSVLNHQSNILCKKILFAQFDKKEIDKHLINKDYEIKYSPWIYFPSNVFDIDGLYNERNKYKNYIDKIAFWGTSIHDRTILNYFDERVLDWGLPIGEFYGYAKRLIKYKVALSISGRGEFCYRDVENFGMGIPIIRFEYVNKVYNELIPNYHYISIDRPDDLVFDRTGNENHAKLIEEKFIKVKDDIDFLNFISKNARKYYEDYLTMNNSINLTYKILNLDEWE
jgi:hypothetical protein